MDAGGGTRPWGSEARGTNFDARAARNTVRGNVGVAALGQPQNTATPLRRSQGRCVPQVASFPFVPSGL